MTFKIMKLTCTKTILLPLDFPHFTIIFAFHHVFSIILKNLSKKLGDLLLQDIWISNDIQYIQLMKCFD